MTNPIRYVLAVVAMSTAVLGCDDDPPSNTPDAGPDGRLRVGRHLHPLEEKGDHIDTGPLASCSSFTVNDAGVSLACGSPESFNLSACNRSTLSQLSRDGIYAARTRSSSSPFFGYGFGTFQISSSGGPEAANTYALVQKAGGWPELLCRQQAHPDGRRHHAVGLRGLRGPGRAELHRVLPDVHQRKPERGAPPAPSTACGCSALSEPETSGIEYVSEAKVELGRPVDVYVAKNHAYVVSLTVGRAAPNPEGGLTVFDVSDKARPVFRKVVTLDGRHLLERRVVQG